MSNFVESNSKIKLTVTAAFSRVIDTNTVDSESQAIALTGSN